MFAVNGTPDIVNAKREIAYTSKYSLIFVDILLECDWNDRTSPEALPQIKHKPLSNLQLTTIDRSQIRADTTYQLAALRQEDPMSPLTAQSNGQETPHGI